MDQTLQSKEDDGIDFKKKSKIHLYLAYQETHFRPEDTYKFKVKGWKRIYHANGSEKKKWSCNIYITK